MRRRLYYARDHARRRGDHSLDRLSILVKVRIRDLELIHEVWIIRRDRLPDAEPLDDNIEARVDPMPRDELPRGIFARGPNRPRSPLNPLDFLLTILEDC